MLDQHVARQVDHRAFEGVADLFLQLIEGGAVGQHRLVDRRFRGEHAELVVGADHRALDEQPVDAARILDRVGQAAAGLEVERRARRCRNGRRDRASAVERPALSPISQASEDAIVEAPTPPRTPITAAMTLGFSLAALVEARAGNGELGIGEGVAQLIGRERLQQIVLDAAGDEIAVEAHVVDLAGGDHHRARLADLGERVDVVERIAAIRERSTNRMLGLAETDSVWTALRRPPLFTFSGDQPCSTAIGRSISAVASSQTKAVKGSRRPARRERRVHLIASPGGGGGVPGCRTAPARDKRGSRGRRCARRHCPSDRPRTRSFGSATIAARLELVAQP